MTQERIRQLREVVAVNHDSPTRRGLEECLNEIEASLSIANRVVLLLTDGVRMRPLFVRALDIKALVEITDTVNKRILAHVYVAGIAQPFVVEGSSHQAALEALYGAAPKKEAENVDA